MENTKESITNEPLEPSCSYVDPDLMVSVTEGVEGVICP